MSTPFQRDGMPNPPQRSNNTDRFSTYLMVDNHQGRVVLQWIAEPRLRRNLQRYAAHDPHFPRLRDAGDLEEQLEQFWINFALNPPPPQEWEPANRHELAFQHLASYYESICHQAAKAIAHKHSQVSWEETLTIARAFIYNPKKLADILRKFQTKGSAKLSTYLHEVLTRTIKSETAVGRYSYWRLVCKTSEKKLLNALETAHYGQREISQILFAQKYFTKVYFFNRVKGRTRRRGETWPLPQPEDFAETAHCYNAERLLPSAPPEVASNPHPVTAEQIQRWMESCFEAVKECKNLEYQTCSLDELNAKLGIEIADPKTEPEDSAWGEFGEDELSLAWFNQTEEIKQLLETELKRCGNIIEVPLSERIWLIDKAKILPLKYGFGFTQKQIAVLCGIQQCKVSRDLTNKYTKPLLKALTQLSQPEGWVSDYVTEWLQKYFPSPNRADIIHAALVESLKQLTGAERELLSLRYGEKLVVTVIGDRWGCSADEVKAKLASIETQLHIFLLNCIGKWMKEYVNHWLHIFYQTPLKEALIHQLKGLPDSIQEGLQLYYKQSVLREQIEQNREESEAPDLTLLWEGRCQLEEGLIQWTADCLDIALTGNEERKKINQIVENWLKNFYVFEGGVQENEI
ncbi:hypothetical protein [Laspinema olomoucense]|uniref:hypothetical protein n=1 Tax=Laspinema olomoucense TaxID=3231600 RepID=UPI0021BAA42D|nr:hypothetical protein [Laspinema sp. D3c]MCT7996105.1 hypothetical protein [Laspinema sp. D3c]